VKGVQTSGSTVIETKQDAPKVESEADEFGLPIRPARWRRWSGSGSEEDELNEGGEGDVFEDAQERPPVPEKDAPNESKDSKIETNGVEAEPSKDAAHDQNDLPSDAENKELPALPGLDDAADRREAEDGVAELKKESRSNSRSSSSPIATRPHASSVSEWSHQHTVAPQIDEEDEKAEEEWQEMPAYATHRIYDDWGKVLAKEYDEAEDDYLAYGTLGGAGKGYTRVQVDDDAQSATSMDDNTAYLFKEPHSTNALFDEDEEGKDLVNQMQTTKELLTEGQRIAYVGVVRLSIGKMLDGVNKLEKTKGTKKQVELAVEAMKMWGQKMMVRLYSHMEIDSAEQVMVEQLAEHGVLPSDLAPALMQNARVKNPANAGSETASLNNSARPSMSSPRPSSTFEKRQSTQNLSVPGTPALPDTPPPSYEEHTADELTVKDPSQIESTKNLDIDIRWTVLCDLFLLLIADSVYDARSRTLLEHVGGALSVEWQEVCRFEKRVTDALEMQEQADKENWNEEEHLESRQKAARKKRMMVMGLCTVGGGLVIGLSAGFLAPVIGAGLAAGFAAINVAGTSTFLAGTGAAALIGTGGAVTGSVIGVRASNRRTGAVKTFEYRPLFNNKRTNLIVTVAGWMTGKVDDVRLPFSTIDPIMGDIYSVNWEPEMLQSTGQTIQILATEALTQTVQQILASTMLATLMMGLSLPIVLTKLSYLIDNPWTVSLARADATGLILADSLIDRNLGVRPITLVGFSLGSRVIFSCLKELAKRGALGLVQNVYLFGSPIVAKKEEYLRARTVVSGRFLNGYATNDWILGYLFRATSGGIMRISGLASVDVEGIENKDVTEHVPGHMAYRAMMPTLLQEVGWLVDELEFTEIEDPDPEDHEKRQRELLNEIEAARYVLEEKEKGASGAKPSGIKAFFSRKKAVKKQWETYDDRSQRLEGANSAQDTERMAEEGKDVMFDVDAIRAEALRLALERPEEVEEIKAHLRVREIESTMPALKVESTPAAKTNGDGLRQTKSHDGTSTTLPATGLTNGGARREDGVTMSFEADERPSLPIPSSSNNTSQQSLPREAQPSQQPAPERPPLKSAVTTPEVPSTATWSSEPQRPPPEIKNPSDNPWADEEEFGREGKLEMSFE
jgi:hypothetical protein